MSSISLKTISDKIEPEMDSEDYQDSHSSENEYESDSVEEPLGSDTSKRKLSEQHQSIKKRKLDSIRPPTVQELNQLRETENLFNSSLFRLQIEEMLKELQMKTKYTRLFQEWFDSFRKFVLGLESSKMCDLTDASCFKNLKVKIPLLMEPISDEGKCEFIPPVNITVGGSFSIEASLGPVFHVDLHVVMSKKLFSKKDFINLRYDRKRAWYLAMLAESLMECELVDEIHFIQGNGSPLKPILELKPSGKLGQHLVVMLWTVTNPFMKPSFLGPDKSNIHSKWFLKTPISKEKECLGKPSPLYNSGIAQDVFWKQNQKMLDEELSSPSLRAGLILLKVWLRQRHLDKGYSSFGGYIMAMFLVYLVQKKRVNKLMSSYQVARVAWSCLAQSDWTKEGISVSTASKCPPLSDFHKYFEVVFIDASGYCNLCAHVNQEMYTQVREASAEAVRLLDAAGSNNFHALFMTPVEFEQNCDSILRLESAFDLNNALRKLCSPEEHAANAGYTLPLLLKLFLSFLKKGLHNRLHSIVFRIPEIQRWTCCEKPPSSIIVPLLFGLRLNSAYADEVLYKGPEADQPEAEIFRSFWGKLSQLRRFRDGRICEVVKWSDDSSPCKQVIDFVLSTHLHLKQKSYTYISKLEHQVMKHHSMRNEVLPRKWPDAITISRTIMASFDSVTKMLRSLNNIALSVNAVQGISAVFRYTDVYPPVGVQLKSFLKSKMDCKGSSLLLQSTNYSAPLFCAPIEAVMTLEQSGKWPRDLQAVRRLKAGICLQMAIALQKQFKVCAQAHVDHLDIVKDGFVFRIWLAALKEISLRKRQVDDFGLARYHDTAETMGLEEKLVLFPKITSSLHGLHLQHPGFGPSASLVKRWLSSQLLGPPHIPDVVSDLLVAHLFLSPEPFCRASEAQLGLLQFLRLVSSTDWLTVPLILNFNDEFSRERIAELETEFHSSRGALPAIFLVTPYDRVLSQCTRIAPTVQILLRLGILAKEARRQLQGQLMSSKPSIQQIFSPNLHEYDVIIKLITKQLPRNYEMVNKKSYPPLLVEKVSMNNVPIVGYDPVQYYLTELREAYSFCALFFHDQHGGEVIGVVWKPSIMEDKDFKVSNNRCSKPTKNSNITLNVDAILEDFKVLGTGLVESVEVQNANS